MYPKFSVLMSLYIKEKAEYFDACMQSILEQTQMPSEIVIVEDGPLSKELRERILYFKTKYPSLIQTVSYDMNRGLGYALSVGILACNNELVARMDTDDIARCDRFEKQLERFIEDPDLGICGSNIDEFEGNVKNIVAKRTVPITDNEIKQYQKRRDAFNHMTVMYRKSEVLKAGNYKSCPLMEDTLLWVHMIQSGVKCENINESLVFARIGSEMYERRGGWSYFMKYREGRRKIKETGYISNIDYYYTIILQFIVALFPGTLRGWVFKSLLHR